MKGMLVGIRKELKVEKVKVKKRNGLIEVALKVKGRKWNVIGVYVRRDLEKKLEELNKWMERKEENGCILIGGDFNARTGEEGRVISKGYEEEEGVGRRSKDKRINKEGKELLRWIEKAGWTIFNECTKGDVEGEWTYTGRSGNSVIDYVLGDEDARMQVNEVAVGDNIDSDHHPIIYSKKRVEEVEREGRYYREAKGKYKKLIEGKKKEEKKRWEREVREIKTEGQVWELVNRGRRRRRKVNEDISMEKWDGKGFRIDEGESRSEIRAVIGRLKDNKAVGADGIPSEVWKYGGKNVEEWIWKICNRLLKGEGWIDKWNEGMIVPILKKEEGERVKEYRGVSLTSTLYKVYASVLAGRLSEKVEEKGLVPQNQTGFRKELGTMDNIFILNYLMNRQLSKKKVN
ncbi:hypothetical protein ACFW04_012648 [Cataglyphis niger]